MVRSIRRRMRLRRIRNAALLFSCAALIFFGGLWLVSIRWTIWYSSRIPDWFYDPPPDFHTDFSIAIDNGLFSIYRSNPIGATRRASARRSIRPANR